MGQMNFMRKKLCHCTPCGANPIKKLEAALTSKDASRLLSKHMGGSIGLLYKGMIWRLLRGTSSVLKQKTMKGRRMNRIKNKIGMKKDKNTSFYHISCFSYLAKKLHKESLI